MARYIELTTNTGRLVYVNPDHVESIEEVGGRATGDEAALRFHSGSELVVRGFKTEIANELSDREVSPPPHQRPRTLDGLVVGVDEAGRTANGGCVDSPYVRRRDRPRGSAPSARPGRDQTVVIRSLNIWLGSDDVAELRVGYEGCSTYTAQSTSGRGKLGEGSTIEAAVNSWRRLNNHLVGTAIYSCSSVAAEHARAAGEIQEK